MIFGYKSRKLELVSLPICVSTLRYEFHDVYVIVIMDILPLEIFMTILDYLELSDLYQISDINWRPIIIKDVIQKRLENEAEKETSDLLHLCIDPHEVAYFLAQKIPNHERDLQMSADKGTTELLSYIRKMPESFDILCQSLDNACQPFLSDELKKRVSDLSRSYLNIT